MTPTNKELLPCPFCGSPDLFVMKPTCNKKTPYNPADRAFPIVRCRNCYVCVNGANWDDSCKSAISKWNTRAELSRNAATSDDVTVPAELVEQWIPITERLPDEGADVLAWCGWAITSTYVDWDFWTEDGTNRLNTVTHWMPLPEPPT